MKSQKELQKKAKRLLALSLDASGVPSLERVRAVLQSLLAVYSPLEAKRLIKHYRRFLLREFYKTHGLLEYAGELPSHIIEAYQSHLQSTHQRSIILRAKQCDELIAGLRLTLGDYVWESSLSSRLYSLQASF